MQETYRISAVPNSFVLGHMHAAVSPVWFWFCLVFFQSCRILMQKVKLADWKWHLQSLSAKKIASQIFCWLQRQKNRCTDASTKTQEERKKEKWLPGYTTVFWKNKTCFFSPMKDIQEKNFWDRYFLIVLCKSFQQSLKRRLKLPSITTWDFQSWSSITTLLDAVTKKLMKHDQPEGIECKHKIA